MKYIEILIEVNQMQFKNNMFYMNIKESIYFFKNLFKCFIALFCRFLESQL